MRLFVHEDRKEDMKESVNKEIGDQEGYAMKTVNQTVLEKINELLKEVVQCDDEALEVDGETYVNSLGLDSLERIDLVCALEREFGIVIPNERVYQLETINDLMLLITPSKTKRKTAKDQIS